MKISKKYIFSLLITSLITINVLGQFPMSLYYMETIPQLTYLNPAMQPRANGYINIVGVNFNFHNDLSLRDVYQKHGNNWHLPIEQEFDFKKIYKRMGNSHLTSLGMEVHFPFASGGKRINDGYFNWSIMSFAGEMQLGLPKDLFKIVDRGLPHGSELDLSPFRAKMTGYIQFLFGYSHKITDELTVGANARILFGQAFMMYQFKKFDATFDRDLWHFDVVGEAISSFESVGLNDPDEYQEDGVTDFGKLQDNLDGSKILKSLFGNPGLAGDIGVVYKLNDDITLSAAINNLGFITWRNAVVNTYDGKIDFDGLKYDDPNDDFKAFFDEIGDSLKVITNTKVENKNVTTSLVPYLYVGGQYHFTDAISVGLLSRTTFVKNNVRQSFSLSGNMLLYEFVSLNLSLNQHLKSGTDAGIGLSLELGPLQFFFLADCIPLRYSKVYDGDEVVLDFFPTSIRDAYFYTGVNLLFGKRGPGKRDKPMLDRRY